LIEALHYPFFQRALLAGVLAAVACGVVGSFVVVKRIASISGGLSHAAFGGVGLGYLAGFDPTLGATAFALLSATVSGFAYRRMRASLDTLIAMMWAIGMALGIVFLSLTPGYKSDLMAYLFGSILFVPERYVWMTLGLDVGILVAVGLLFKELQAVAFDEEFAEVVGVPVGGLIQGLLAMIAVAVVVLIKVAGVILVIALLTIPAAIARHWTSRLRSMMALAAVLGAACNTAGLLVSYEIGARWDVNVPTGPLIILIAATLYGASALAARMRRP
jgi:zinc transport system permease protein